jgi:Sec-independent protein translocase protein TatA
MVTPASTRREILSMIGAGAVLTGWWVGLTIGAVIIAVVVVLVAIILGMARRIAVQAKSITGALNQARVNTLPLWDVDKVNEGLRLTAKHASEARAALEGRR